MRDLIELTDTWACRITLCGNSETLCSGYDINLDEEEAAAEACDAARAVVYDLIGDFPDVSVNFAEWNGGKHARASFRIGPITAEVYHRKVDYVDDGDVVWLDWEWVNGKDVPPIIKHGIEDILTVACNAMTQKLQEAERNVPKLES